MPVQKWKRTFHDDFEVLLSLILKVTSGMQCNVARTIRTNKVCWYLSSKLHCVTFLWNDGTYLPRHMAIYPRNQL